MEFKGLTQKEAEKELQRHGYNELEGREEKTLLRIVFDVAREPMFLLLLSCTVLYLFLGELREGVIIASSIVLIVAISIYQNRRTEKALKALKKLATPLVTVVRDGQMSRIPGRNLVPGDVVVIREGDRIPADATLLFARNLSVDESLLTGESAAVGKDDVNSPAGTPAHLQAVYGGTMVVRGEAYAQVTATGSNTKIGRIGESIKSIKEDKTVLQKEVDGFIRRISVIGVAFCVLLMLLYIILRGNVIDGILSGIALSIALIPEEFPVVYTIFMAMGAWRIARKKVVTRTPSSIEALGAVTTLCVDKTGTITQNKMAVRALSTGRNFIDFEGNAGLTLPEEYHTIIEYGILASHSAPFDPMEKAILEIGSLRLKDTEHIHANWKSVREYPLSGELLAMSRAYVVENNYLVAVKGAPEAIIRLCHLQEEETQEILHYVRKMAAMGLRVLAVAHCFSDSSPLPEKQSDFNFQFCGLIGLADPIRNDVPQAVHQCYTAGIRVIMITGDYPATAQSIARQIGLSNSSEVLTGQDIENMSHEEIAGKLRTTNIFARIAPEQKLMIVNTLKSHGEIVAMTGDGVNDAPALKAAHIGIAMGGRGTDVAREASSLVLLDDNFSSIVAAVRLGRRIFDNIQKAWSYVLSMHIPIIGISLVPIFFRHIPPILMPVHIVFMELIIDPVSSIVFENQNEDIHIMERRPRDRRKKFFSKKRIAISTINGLSMLVATIAAYLLATTLHLNNDQVRAVTFSTLILSNLLLALSDLSGNSLLKTLKNPGVSAKVILGAAILMLATILFTPFFRNIFHLQTVPLHFLGISVVTSLLSIGWLEASKLRHPKNKATTINSIK